MRILIALFLLGTWTPSPALNVFSCEPEWTALVTELAGERVTVTTATTYAQDPHYVEARPSLIADFKDADLLVCSGAQLEQGWLPLLLRRSGNSALQPGQPGNFMAADHVRRLEVPTVLDRSQGDIHPQGNPHIHLDPNNIRRIAAALTRTLKGLDPSGSASYDARYADFEQRWREATRRWEDQARPLAGKTVITHHRSFSYLVAWLGMTVAANIEPKPGIPPSSAHLASLLEQFQGNPPMAILRTPYTAEKPSAWLSERLSVPAAALPYTVGGDDTSDLFELFDTTVQRLLELTR